MRKGILTHEISKELDKLAEIEKAYLNLRKQGLDLYTVRGNKMIALPDERREHAGGNCLQMTEQDWKKYSKAVKRDYVTFELSQKDFIMNQDNSRLDLIREGLKTAQTCLANEEKLIKPLTDYCSSKLFNAEKIRSAMEGNLVTIHSNIP